MLHYDVTYVSHIYLFVHNSLLNLVHVNASKVHVHAN